jgi:hypothetical protein
LSTCGGTILVRITVEHPYFGAWPLRYLHPSLIPTAHMSIV